MALYTEAELSKKTLADLKELAEQNDLEVEDGWKKRDYIEALADLEADEDEFDEDEELDDEVDDTEEDEVDDEELDDPEEEDEIVEEKPAKAKKSTAKPKREPKPDSVPAKVVASELNIEAKTLRQFLRSSASPIKAVGSGGRYEFTPDEVEKIKTAFTEAKANAPARGTGGGRGRGKKSKDSTPAEVIEEVDEIEELDFDDDELDDEDLELED